MLRAFNSFQAVLAFALAPFGISWLSEASFRGAGVAFWVVCVAYVVGFIMMCAAVFVAVSQD